MSIRLARLLIPGFANPCLKLVPRSEEADSWGNKIRPFSSSKIDIIIIILIINIDISFTLEAAVSFLLQCSVLSSCNRDFNKTTVDSKSRVATQHYDLEYIKLKDWNESDANWDSAIASTRNERYSSWTACLKAQWWQRTRYRNW